MSDTGNDAAPAGEAGKGPVRQAGPPQAAGPAAGPPASGRPGPKVAPSPARPAAPKAGGPALKSSAGSTEAGMRPRVKPSAPAAAPKALSAAPHPPAHIEHAIEALVALAAPCAGTQSAGDDIVTKAGTAEPARKAGMEPGEADAKAAPASAGSVAKPAAADQAEPVARAAVAADEAVDGTPAGEAREAGASAENPAAAAAAQVESVAAAVAEAPKVTGEKAQETLAAVAPGAQASLLETATETVETGPEAPGPSSGDIPSAMRAAAGRGSGRQAPATHDPARAAPADAASLLGRALADTTRDIAQMQAKMIEAARENADAAFDLARRLANARSVGEAVEAQTVFARRQLKTFTAHARDMTSLSLRVARDVTEPVRAGLDRAAEIMRRGG